MILGVSTVLFPFCWKFLSVCHIQSMKKMPSCRGICYLSQEASSQFVLGQGTLTGVASLSWAQSDWKD